MADQDEPLPLPGAIGVQKVGSCVITIFAFAAAAFLITSNVDITVVAMPMIAVSASPPAQIHSAQRPRRELESRQIRGVKACRGRYHAAGGVARRL